MKTKIGKTRFLSFLYDREVWIGIGGPLNWEDENIPDSPINTAKNITNPVVLVKATKTMCYLNPNGDLSYGAIKYSSVLDDELDVYLPDTIYCEISIDSTIIPVGQEWRQTGLYIDVVKEGSVEANQTVLDPNEIDDYGYMLDYENHNLRILEAGETRKIISLIEL